MTRHTLATTIALMTAFIAAVGAAAAQPQGSYSWQQPHAKVIATGDLEWAPQPFEFKPGASVRYIDYDAGDDNNSGETKDLAWKHHPWDAAATGRAAQASGVITYVFKRGVSYRATLTADESGQPGKPVQLTSDPAWGQGEAVLSGSRAVRGGWTRADAASAPGIPEPQKVWYVDLDRSFFPRAVWLAAADESQTVRLALARDPNWTISNPEDVKSEWYTWKHSEKQAIRGEEGRDSTRAWAVDPDRLTETDPDAFRGGTVWTEYVSVMGQPYPAPIEAYDPARHAIRVGGPWGDAGQYAPVWMNRYYLENLPRFLDSPGEYYYDEPRGRLYVRLPGDADPNSAVIELAERTTQIDIRNQSHIEISGLAFRYGNVAQWYDRWWTINEVDPAGVKVLGACKDIRISNCTFRHVPLAVYARSAGEGVAMDHLSVTDNDIAHVDYAAIDIAAGGGRDRSEGLLDHVSVLRNRITDAGMRPRRAGQGHTLTVEFPRTAEIAGNILHRTGGAGVFIFGGKAGGGQYDVPLSRIFVHHNKVTDSLVWTNDYGGIETWQGGPMYVYNNVSGNPGGYWNFIYQGAKDKPKTELTHTSARFGFAYYFDGSFKNYVFNNIAWGKTSELGSPLAATTAFHEVIGFLNTFSNNTAYRFVAPFRRQVPQGGRGTYIGNVIEDASEVFFRHADIERPQDVHLAPAAADAESAADTLAYANNVVFGQPRLFGYFQRGQVHATLENFQAGAQQAGAVSSQTGWTAEKSPLRDPAAGDFRPANGSAARDRGVKTFVPWSLYGTAGEWNFRPHPADPAVVPGDDWYMTAAYVEREMYRQIPRNDLTAHNMAVGNYVQGPLDDWAPTALTFNGRDQHLSLSHEQMTRDVTYGRRGRTSTIPGGQRASLDMGENGFVIEAYLKVEQGRGNGVVVSKMSQKAGYELIIDERGAPALVLRFGDRTGPLVQSEQPINDGLWHHLLVEVDRANKTASLYIDGAAVQTAGGLPSFDLSNTADFLVGKGPDGRYFAGAIDFLRISRGSLADSDTTIQELYAWQFDGPQFRDFAGRSPADGKRDAGALEGE